MLDSDAESAKTLVLVAIILQLVFFIIGISFLSFVFYLIIGAPVPGSGPVGFNIGNLFAIIFVTFAFIGLVWLVLDYVLIYSPLRRERVSAAETPALILGILQLIFSGFTGIISGILVIIAWMKIRDSLSINPANRQF